MPDQNDTVKTEEERAPAPPPPVYRKPTLRRYDQIEQVKPYGPSDRKAG